MLFRGLGSLLGALWFGVVMVLGLSACSDLSGVSSPGDVTSLVQGVASGRSLSIRTCDSETGLGLHAQVSVRQRGAGEALLAIHDVTTAEAQIAVLR